MKKTIVLIASAAAMILLTSACEKEVPSKEENGAISEQSTVDVDVHWEEVSSITNENDDQIDTLISEFVGGEEVWDTIKNRALANDCDGQLLAVILAIYKSEGDRFGIKHPGATSDLESQAGWAAATVSKNYIRWYEGRKTSDMDFITFLSVRYAPVEGFDSDFIRDESGLNDNWIGNVKHWTKRFLDIMYGTNTGEWVWKSAHQSFKSLAIVRIAEYVEWE